MINQLSSKTLLDPLVFQWFTAYQSRASRIFWDKYNLSNTRFKALQRLVPTQSIHQFFPPTSEIILVVGVDTMNTLVETGESPFLLKAFTGRNGSWTVLRSNLHGVKSTENIPHDIGSSSREAAGFNIATKFEFPFRGNEVSDYSLLRCFRVWQLELVEHEEKLTKMLYSIWVSVFQEATIHIKDSPKVRLQECGYTSTLVSCFKLTWHLEAKLYQSQIQSFSQSGKSFG
jgi:hypothetical protein